MAITDEQLVEVAVKEGLIDAETLAILRLRARRDRIALLDAVTSHGRFPVATLYRALADLRGLPFVDLSAAPGLSPSLVQRLPTEMIQFLRVLPIAEEEETILIATADPDDRATLEAVARILGRPIKIALADPAALDEAIERILAELSRQPVTGVAAVAADSVVLLDRIFKEAFLRRASDIHLEPHPHGVRVRLRVDGWLQVFQTLGIEEGSGVVSRIKVLAGLDIAEQRAPQDGGFSYRLSRGADRTVDIRVATSPTRWGERATLRLLGMETSDLTLEAIGMSSAEMIQFRRVIKQPHGLILLTGPTGSGKSTTLYAALREINRPDLNILTVEDPIEYVIAGISQIQVDGEKVTFASTLRALLRHDPDVLMVGEIRDAETAGVALKAAMTGHLVLSTLHTHSACGAVARLADLGCERYLIGSTLAGVIAQRLVRRLCPRCKQPRPATAKEAALLNTEGRGVEHARASHSPPLRAGLDARIQADIFSVRVEDSPPQAAGNLQIYDAVGCASCLGSGYRGRVGLFETLWIDRILAQRISRGATEEDLLDAAVGKFTSLFSDGCAKVLAGITSLEEVLSATLHEE